MLDTLQAASRTYTCKKGTRVSLRSLQAVWPNKMDAEAAIPRSSLAALDASPF